MGWAQLSSSVGFVHHHSDSCIQLAFQPWLKTSLSYSLVVFLSSWSWQQSCQPYFVAYDSQEYKIKEPGAFLRHVTGTGTKSLLPHSVEIIGLGFIHEESTVQAHAFIWAIFDGSTNFTKVLASALVYTALSSGTLILEAEA